MRLKTAVCVAFLGLSTLACSGMTGGGGASDPLAYVPEAKITEPWTKLNLPIDNGKVSMSDKTNLTVMYSGEDVSGKVAAYGGAIEKAGFAKQSEPSTQPSARSVLYGKNNGTLALTVTSAAGLTTVTLTRAGGGE
jgi:hypothetical protein